MVATHLIYEIVASALLILVSGLFFEGLSRLLQAVVRRAGARAVSMRGIRDTFRILWIIVAAAGLFWIWGFASFLTVLTISGIAGLVVSLALQAVLTNVISGFLLLRDGVLRIGDRIEYSGVKGQIVRIALRNTWVRTDSGSIAVIGNSSLASGPLTNHSAAARLATEFGTSPQPSSTNPPVAKP
jgi:small-conductance mechanosensitive channel